MRFEKIRSFFDRFLNSGKQQKKQEALADFKRILDNTADYSIIQHQSPVKHESLFHIKSQSDVLVEAYPETKKMLFDELKKQNIKVVASANELKNEAERPFYMKWDEEKKDYVKVYRGK